MPRVSDAKEKILDSAMELFWLHNYGSVSVDDICKKADVKKGSFYHFYQSKADLCIACLEGHWNANLEKTDSTFSPSKSPLQRVSDYAKRAYDGQRELQEKYGVVLGCPISLVGTEIGNEDNKVRIVASEIFEKYVKYFESTLRDAVAKGISKVKNVEMRAKQIFSFSMGVMYHAKITNDVEVIKQELEPGILCLMELI